MFLGALAVLIIGAFPAFAGDEPPLAELEFKGIALCINQGTRSRTPCAVFEREGEANVIYLAILDAEGNDIVEVIRQDFNSGKETILWRKPTPALPGAIHYPQQK